MIANYSNSFLSLSLHTDCFCAVCVEGGAVSAVAARELIQRFTPDSIRENALFLDGQVESINKLKEQVGFKGSNVVVTLPASMALIKKNSVALGLSQSEIKEHLIWEAQQALISQTDDYTIAFDNLPFQSTAGHPLFLTVMIRSEIIKKIKNLAYTSGLKLKDIDLDIFSLLRTVNINYAIPEEGLLGIIHMERNSINIVIIKNKDYFLSQTIRMNRKHNEQGGPAVSETVELIIKELRRIIFAHRLGRDINELEAVFLTGNINCEEINGILAKKLNKPVHTVNPFYRLKTSKIINGLNQPEITHAMFASAVGIALKRLPELGRSAE